MLVSDDWIKSQIRESIAKELSNNSNLDEGFLDSIKKGAANLVAKGLDILPKPVIRYLKEYIFTQFAKAFKIDKNSNLGMLVSSAIKEMEVEDITDIYFGEINCEELAPLVSKILSDTITRIGIKKILIYLIQHYDINELLNMGQSIDPLAKEEEKSYHVPSLTSAASEPLMTENQANNFLNSMIGLGMQHLLEEMAYEYITKNIAQDLSDYICNHDFGETVEKAKNVAKKFDKK